ncbi:hypothetical protein R1T40_11710 [Tritonibacter scottomollicae]|uniref:Uncharacterized protein n=1 Tax=Tritonibacter scottomollicae TaxID=483013 RepID=A0ABZ0HB12_TRISK|nr:hypothetical protein [Tritonibacter scottomollicae]WOI31632.1 hypothetical protein R1T40_11710 [Tritonibacter scottomollicae]
MRHLPSFARVVEVLNIGMGQHLLPPRSTDQQKKAHLDQQQNGIKRGDAQRLASLAVLLFFQVAAGYQRDKHSKELWFNLCACTSSDGSAPSGALS